MKNIKSFPLTNYYLLNHMNKKNILFWFFAMVTVLSLLSTSMNAQGKFLPMNDPEQFKKAFNHGTDKTVTLESNFIQEKNLSVISEKLISSGKFYFKNENMIAWEGEKPIVMVPDMICCLREDGQPVTNVDVREGMKVVFFGLKAPAEWRTPQAAGVFAPVLEKIGYSGPYAPIETLLAKAVNN